MYTTFHGETLRVYFPNYNYILDKRIDYNEYYNEYYKLLG